MRNPIILLGYILGGAMFIAGLLILLGVFKLRAGDNTSFSTIFGVVLLLFGIYRIVVTQGKQRQEKRNKEAKN